MSYVAHLKKDKILKPLVVAKEPFSLTKKKSIWLSLCRSIISQQLSTKVAEVIYSRFEKLFAEAKITPAATAAMPDLVLREAGLSFAKIGYIKNVAQFEIDHGMHASKLNKMSNEEVIVYLTQIKGVGRWTVEMLLMFTLGRENIFAVDDLGIKNAMVKLYGLEQSNKKNLKQAMQEIAAKWDPFQTYACLHLWHWKDEK